MSKKFPENFIWGCATSSYQIEGAAYEDGRGETIWDVFCRVPGNVVNNDTGDIACDHYHRFKEDINIIKSLGIKAYRFSISWARILPQGKGKINQKGIDFYNKLIDTLLENNIIPFITLYHWDLPYELNLIGGWKNREIANYFAEYARIISDKFSDRVKYFITLNEPLCIVNKGYKIGEHAPGEKITQKYVNYVMHNLYIAHGLAVISLKENAKQNIKVGIAHNPVFFIPYDETDQTDIESAKKAFYDYACWWLDPLFKKKYPEKLWNGIYKSARPVILQNDMEIIGQPLDFLGLNIYSGFPVKSKNNGYKIYWNPDGYQRTEMNWLITPSVIYWALRFVSEIYKPAEIYVTENGAAFDDKLEDNKVKDIKRIEFLKGYIESLHKAVDEGINVKGYFLWSLMDNFEWEYGYSKRFGIVYIDYKNNLKRIIKDSGYWYKQLIERNAI